MMDEPMMDPQPTTEPTVEGPTPAVPPAVSMSEVGLMRLLPVPLSRADRESITAQQAQDGEVCAKAEAELARVTRDLTRTISDLKTRIHQATLTLRHGEIVKPVAVEERTDYEHGFVRTYRLDTGAQVDQRAMTPQEMAERPGA